MQKTAAQEALARWQEKIAASKQQLIHGVPKHLIGVKESADGWPEDWGPYESTGPIPKPEHSNAKMPTPKRVDKMKNIQMTPRHPQPPKEPAAPTKPNPGRLNQVLQTIRAYRPPRHGG